MSSSTSSHDAHTESEPTASTSDPSDFRSSTQYSFTPSPETSKTSTKPDLSDDEEKKDDSMFVCNICLDIAKDAVVSMCGHLYCWPCLSEFRLLTNFTRKLPENFFRHLAGDASDPPAVPRLQGGDFQRKSDSAVRPEQWEAAGSAIEGPATSTRPANRARSAEWIQWVPVVRRRRRLPLVLRHRSLPVRILRFQL